MLKKMITFDKLSLKFLYAVLVTLEYFLILNTSYRLDHLKLLNNPINKFIILYSRFFSF